LNSTRLGGFCLCSRGFNRRVIENYPLMKNHLVKSSTRVGGFCLCSRGFNRRVIENYRLMKNHLQPASAGFVCVAAVSTAG
jgi:hypothetical protein